MIDRDRFSDEYDPEPDYDRPTRGDLELDEEPCDICGGTHVGLCPDDPSEQEDWVREPPAGYEEEA